MPKGSITLRVAILRMTVTEEEATASIKMIMHVRAMLSAFSVVDSLNSRSLTAVLGRRISQWPGSGTLVGRRSEVPLSTMWYYLVL